MDCLSGALQGRYNLNHHVYQLTNLSISRSYRMYLFLNHFLKFVTVFDLFCIHVKKTGKFRVTIFVYVQSNSKAGLFENLEILISLVISFNALKTTYMRHFSFPMNRLQ